MDEPEQSGEDFAERAAEATEESRREHAGRRIEDEPESGRLAGEPPDDEVDPRT